MTLNEILTQDDDLLKELLREEIERAEEEDASLPVQESSTTKTEIDELIPDAPDVNRVLALKPAKVQSKVTEWVQVVDVHQDFPDFHSLVPSLALDVCWCCS